MSLKRWQKKQNLSNVKLASLLHIDPSFLTHYYAGRRNFSPQLALKIEQLTNGEVTCLELLYPDNKKINTNTKISFFKSIKNFFRR